MILPIELIVHRKYQKEIQMCSRKVQTATNRFFLLATPTSVICPYGYTYDWNTSILIMLASLIFTSEAMFVYFLSCNSILNV